MIEIDTSWEWIAMYGPVGGRWKVRVGGDDGTFDAKYLKYSTVRYIIVRYSIVQYSTVLYSTLQYNTVYIGPYSSKFMIDTTVDNNGNNW